MIKFTWDIHYKCNFRCPYCWFFKSWAELSKQNTYLSPEEWLIHWKRVYDKYGESRIEIVGGEPFIYPNFIELVRQLSSIHLVKVTTNLSGDVERFAKEIEPERVDLDLNFHILFIDLDTVIKKVLILKKAGFRGGVCYLAYPPQMFMIRNLSERFQREGINFALAAFWGEYNGKRYPEAYTEEERGMMRPYLGDTKRQTYHLNAQSPKGKLCNAGYRYVSVRADGDVVRCGSLGDRIMGNILNKGFELFKSPLPCEADVCPCDEYVNLVDEDSLIPSDNSQVQTSVVPPRFSTVEPPYRVHWNWELSYKCNYTCSYCPWWHRGNEDERAFPELSTLKDIRDRIFEHYWSCHIRFSGGEPTIYPKFFELVSILLERHTVDITTNLSFDIEDFTKKIRPGGISISASFHPEFAEFEPFLEKVLFLHKSGYPSTISYVAYPPHLEKIKDFKTKAEERQILFKVIPYNGGYQGRDYPQNYSDEERRAMECLAADSQDAHLNELNTRWLEWNVARDKEKIEGKRKEKLCRMGERYAKIYPDGTVARCCAKDKAGVPIGILGSIFSSDFKLLDEPAPCEVERCPCFKSMLVGFEEDKWAPLWEATEHPVYKTKGED